MGTELYRNVRGVLKIHSLTYGELSDTPQRAFGVKMTSDQRRCDVMTSHRR